MRRWVIVGLIVIVVLGAIGYRAANQLRLAARSVPLPASAEVAYEYGETGDLAFAGTDPLYQRFAVAEGTPDQVCADLERLLGTGYRPYQMRVSNPRPCEWEGTAWGARVRVSVLDITEIAPNNHPVSAPAGSSLVVVVAD